MKPKSTRLARLFGTAPQLASGLVLSLVLSGRACATDYYWDGGSGTVSTWGDAANWNPDGTPATGSANYLHFTGATRLTPDNNYTLWDDFGGLLFDSGAGSFTIGGNAIDLFGKIENNSTSAQTVNIQIGTGTLTGSFIEMNPVAGNLTIGGNVYLGDNQLRIWGNNAKTLAFGGSSIISGSGTVAINQNSTVVFNSGHTYTGETFINAGILQFNSGASAASGFIRLGDTGGTAAAALAVASSGSIANSINVRAGSTGVKSINSLATSGTATVSGSVYLDADATTSSASGGILAFAGTEFDLKAQTLTVGGAGSTTISNVLKNTTGTGNLIKTGGGTLTLSGANTYTGSTFISAGTLGITGSGVLGGTTGSSLDANNIVFTGASGSPTLTFETSANLGSAGQIRFRTTGGTAGNLDFAGTTAATVGKTIQCDTSYGIRLNSDSVAGLVKYNGSFSQTNRPLYLGGSGTGNNELAMVFAGTGVLTKDGAGTWILSGANTFSSNVAISNGILKFGVAGPGNVGTTGPLGAINTAVTKCVVASGATLDVNGFVDTNYGVTIAGTGTAGQGALINTGAATSSGKIQLPNITLSSNASIGGSGDFYMIANGYGANTLGLAGFTLTKTGANTFYLANTTVNAGAVRISGGTLSQFKVSNGSAAAFSLDNTANVKLDLNNLALSVGSLAGGGATGGNVTMSGSLTVGALNTDTFYAGIISGSGALTKNGSGKLTLSANNAYTGNTTISAGTLKVSGAGSSLYNSAYNNTAVLTVSSGGTLELDNFGYDAAGSLGKLADYGIRRVLDGGTINIVGITQSSGNDFQVANGRSGIFNMISSGEKLTLSGNGNSNIAIGGALTFGGDGNITVTEQIDNNTGAGSIIKAGAGTLTLNNTGNTFTGNITLNGGTVFGIGGTASGSTGSPFGSKSGSRTITTNSGTTLWLTSTSGSSNTFGGGGMSSSQIPSMMIDGGTVRTGKFNTIGNVTLKNGGHLSNSSQETGGTYQGYQFIGDITVSGTGTGTFIDNNGSHANSPGDHLKNGSTTFTVDDITASTAADLTVSSVLLDGSGDYSGAGALVKAGAGTMVLTGNNTYTGATTVTSGKLVVNGNISTSTTTVKSGATVGGSGTLGALTIESGGTVAPGNSPGILTTGDYMQAGNLGVELDGISVGSLYDQLNVHGSVTLTGLLAATVGYSPLPGDMLFILANDGTDAINGTFSGIAHLDTITLDGYQWRISYQADYTGLNEGTFTGGNDIALMAVPEPAAALLGGIGILLLLRRRR